MKKLDKLILSAFLGPFILTFLVVVFILLTQHMLKYFDDIIGKGLGMDVIGQLLFYFGVFMTPIAMPLAVLLSSLITFGNLGEHFELTAVKSAGISLVRALFPIFFFVLGLTVVAFYVNNNLVPKAALEAYSLLYDIKQKKPALDLREGSFYDGIPDISIKVNKKFSDGVTIKDVIIYDHRKHDGNKEVTTADSGKMYTILNERYLKLELFNGSNYTEGASTNQEMTGRVRRAQKETLSQTKFSKTQIVFDLSSFALERTDKKWFQGNRIMRNLGELDSDLDSIDNEMMQTKLGVYQEARTFFNYYMDADSFRMPEALQQFKVTKDSTDRLKLVETDGLHRDSINAEKILPDSVTTIKPLDSGKRRFFPARALTSTPKRIKYRNQDRVQPQDSIALNKSRNTEGISKKPGGTDYKRKTDSLFNLLPNRAAYENAASKARMAKNEMEGTVSTLKEHTNDRNVFLIQWHKILASSLACIAMFLIGAPLGAIIKKGGLGVPFLVSILFFIIYYLLTMTGEKWAKQGIISVHVGVWAADVILFVIGLLFLRQARLDARLFEADFYMVMLEKAKKSNLFKRFFPATVA
ncbi:MAG: LptF/LptG family permease [Cyclobacteriaceae bacterium]